MDKHNVAALIEVAREKTLLPRCWELRRPAVTKAIDRQARDVDVVETLLRVLGIEHQVASREREEIKQGRRAVNFLDSVLSTRIGFVGSEELAGRLVRIWLIVEVRFRPDERGWLADVRDRLIRTAEHREIDLRGLGV